MADDLADMMAFVRIGESGSLSAAARELGQSLTAVSRRLARLEERLGVRLVNRTTRRLSLTPEGETYRLRATGILDDIREAEAEVARGRNEPTGQLRITSTFAFGRRKLAPLLLDLEARHPGLRIHLDVSDRVVDVVESGFDMAIRFGALLDSSLIARSLVDNFYVLCAAPAYLDRRGRPVAIDDLTRHDCVRFGSPLPDRWNFADGRSVRISGDLTTNDGELAHAWVLAGAGITLKAIWDVADDLRRGALEVVLPQERLPSAAVHAVFAHNRLNAARVRLTLDFLAQRLKEEWESEPLALRPD